MTTSVDKFSQLASALASQAPNHISLISKWKPVLPKYKPVRLLGRGSSSEVILAEVRGTQDQVAIKHIQIKQDSAQAVLRELSILRALSAMPENSHTLKLLDLVMDEAAEDGRPLSLFVVTEFYPFSLADILNSPDQAVLTDEEVMKLACGIITSLAFLHSANVLHRDLKPSNVLLTTNLEVRLCDFGLSRSLPEHTESVTDYMSPSYSSEGSEWLSPNGLEEEKPVGGLMTSHVFTRFYRPPEVILLQRYGFAADIWSAGCIIYEILASSARYHKSLLDDLQSRVLFRGGFCEPLSPRQDSCAYLEGPSGKGQLDIILEVLGYQQDTQLEFYDLNAQAKIDSIQSMSMAAPLDLAQLFFYTSLEFLDLLEQMLSFSPDLRSTASQLLEHPVWNDNKMSTPPPLASKKIRIASDSGAKPNLSQSEWLKLVWREALSFDEERS